MLGACKESSPVQKLMAILSFLIFLYTSLNLPLKIKFRPCLNRRRKTRSPSKNLLLLWTKSKFVIQFWMSFHYSLNFQKQEFILHLTIVVIVFFFNITGNRGKKAEPRGLVNFRRKCAVQDSKGKTHHTVWLPGNLSAVQHQNIKVITKAQASHRLSL